MQLEKVIQQNASASEEMASTTEELSSQSDQLVSALAFFRTGDEGHMTRSVAARPTRHFEAAAGVGKASKPASSSVSPAMKAGAKPGVSLKMKDRDKDKNDDLDKEFERF